MNNDSTQFQFTCCDSCFQKSVCTVHYYNGIPVIATCKTCDLRAFQNKASQQINQWLIGK